jgi:hypothetical protein
VALYVVANARQKRPSTRGRRVVPQGCNITSRRLEDFINEIARLSRLEKLSLRMQKYHLESIEIREGKPGDNVRKMSRGQ